MVQLRAARAAAAPAALPDQRLPRGMRFRVYLKGFRLICPWRYGCAPPMLRLLHPLLPISACRAACSSEPRIIVMSRAISPPAAGCLTEAHQLELACAKM